MDSYGDRHDYYLEDKETEFKALCYKWFSYGEGITLCVDTETKTIGVE